MSRGRPRLAPHLRRALSELSERLDRVERDWVVGGSVAMALHGVTVEPRDIDVITDRQGAYEIESALDESMIEAVRFLESEKLRSHFGRARVAGSFVEIIGDFDILADGTPVPALPDLAARQFVAVGARRIPIPPVDPLREMYRRLGRADRIVLLLGCSTI